MRYITFNRSTTEGLILQTGELIEHNGFQYALCDIEGYYRAIELSTGFSAHEIDSDIDMDYAKDYLIEQIKKNKITPRVLERTKEIMKTYGIKFPANDKY